MRRAIIAASLLGMLALSGCAPAAGALGGAAVGDAAADAPATGALIGGAAGLAL